VNTKYLDKDFKGTTKDEKGEHTAWFKHVPEDILWKMMPILSDISVAIYDKTLGHKINPIPKSKLLAWDVKLKKLVKHEENSEYVLVFNDYKYTGEINGIRFEIIENTDKDDAEKVISKILDIKEVSLDKIPEISENDRLSIQIGGHIDNCLAAFSKSTIHIPTHASGRVTAIAGDEIGVLDFRKLFLHEYGHYVLDCKRNKLSILNEVINYVEKNGLEEFLPISPIFIQDMWERSKNYDSDKSGAEFIAKVTFAEELVVEVWAQKLFNQEEFPEPVKNVSAHYKDYFYLY
jgi:hypothetical protein